MRTKRSERGAGLLEYAGLVIMCCGILVGLARTPLGDDVVGACRTAICAITGGDCADDGRARADAGGPQRGRPRDPAAGPAAAPAGRPLSGGPNRARFCNSPTANGRQPMIHSHNDYLHDRPLLDALDHHAQSVEADLYWDKGKLNLRHNPKGGLSFLGGERNQNRGRFGPTYIDELRKRIRANGGKVYPDQTEPFYLNVEIKDKDKASQENVFKAVVEQHRALQDEIRRAGGDPKTVRLVFSGAEPPAETWDALVPGGLPPEVWYDQQYSGDKCENATKGPMHPRAIWVSLDWESCVSGNDKISPEEQDYLNRVAAMAHAQDPQRGVRTWGAPDDVVKDPVNETRLPSKATMAAWDAQAKAGVDHLNTDSLTGLRQYLGQCPG